MFGQKRRGLSNCVNCLIWNGCLPPRKDVIKHANMHKGVDLNVLSTKDSLVVGSGPLANVGAHVNVVVTTFGQLPADCFSQNVNFIGGVFVGAPKPKKLENT